jgi:hypothetical protein
MACIANDVDSSEKHCLPGRVGQSTDSKLYFVHQSSREVAHLTMPGIFATPSTATLQGESFVVLPRTENGRRMELRARSNRAHYPIGGMNPLSTSHQRVQWKKTGAAKQIESIRSSTPPWP